MAEKAASLKKEWNACLSQSGGYPARCEKIEKEFAAASKSAGIESCTSETTNLMRCTMGTGKKNGCGAEFMMMRESIVPVAGNSSPKAPDSLWPPVPVISLSPQR